MIERAGQIPQVQIQTAHSPARFVVRATSTSRGVEAWTSSRLGGNRKSWQLEFQRAVQRELALLVPDDQALLHAEYAPGLSSAGDPDLVNVLFRYLGAGSFADLDRNGLRFERAHAMPRPPEQLVGSGVHFSRWALSHRHDQFRHWEEGAPAAAWHDVPLDAVRTDHSLIPTWHAFRTAPCALGEHLGESAHFGIRLVLTAPRGSKSNAARVVRPLLDGSLASLQVQDGTGLQSVATSIGAALRKDPREIAKLLASDDRAVLGRSPLLGHHGYILQWFSGATRCVAGEVLIRRLPVNSWSCSGRVFAVTPITR